MKIFATALLAVFASASQEMNIEGRLLSHIPEAEIEAIERHLEGSLNKNAVKNNNVKVASSQVSEASADEDEDASVSESSDRRLNSEVSDNENSLDSESDSHRRLKKDEKPEKAEPEEKAPRSKAEIEAAKEVKEAYKVNREADKQSKDTNGEGARRLEANVNSF